MPNYLTPAERAAAVIDTVKAELPLIWCGGRQRMVLEQAIAEAVSETRRLALEEASVIAIEQVKEGDATALEWNKACSHICHELDRLAREGA